MPPRRGDRCPRCKRRYKQRPYAYCSGCARVLGLMEPDKRKLIGMSRQAHATEALREFERAIKGRPPTLASLFAVLEQLHGTYLGGDRVRLKDGTTLDVVTLVGSPIEPKPPRTRIIDGVEFEVVFDGRDRRETP